MNSEYDLHQLRRIGWDLWDPIDLRGFCSKDLSAGPIDEYDEFMISAYKRLEAGQDIEKVAEYLQDIAENYIGVWNAYENFGRSLRTAEALSELLRA